MRKNIRHLIRTYPIRTRILFGTFLIAVVLVAIECFLVIFAYPRTTIGIVPFAGKTRNQTEKKLRQIIARPVKVSVGDRVYEFRYADMGLSVDVLNLVWLTYRPNISFFPKNAVLFFQTLIYGHAIEIKFEETPDFERIVSGLTFEKTNGGDEIIFNQKTKEISYIERDTKKVVDRARFIRLLENNFGSNTVLVPDLIDVPNPNKVTIESINKALMTTYDTPLRVRVIASSGEINIELSPENLKQIITFSLSPETNTPVFGCSPETLFRFIPVPAGATISPHTAKSAILDAMMARYNGTVVRDITITSGDGPKTSGEIAPKYAEIDISSQRLYTFSEGSLVKTYRVSTGLYYPTPTGTFRILNKAPNAFSAIYNVWMPWWMAFGFSNELNAYFGIHELPYWLSSDGIKKQRPRERIGTPSTGGCVALDIGEAEEFYNWADIGMPVIIYK